MVADKPFGLTFLNVSGAFDVHLSYLNLFGGPQDGRGHFGLWYFVGIDRAGEPYKGGVLYQHTVTTDC